jgi:outer membrane protein OmpA-like peptidoglycan-associated protein
MRIYFTAVTILFLSFWNTALTQTNPLLDKGDKAFDKFNYEQAMYFYETVYETSPSDPAVTRRIADTYRRLGQLNMSAEWYRKTLELDPSNASDMLYYAEALKSMQEYDEAIFWYENYQKLVPHDARAQSHLRDKMYYKDLFADTLRYDMKRQRINTAMPVINASWFSEDKVLVSAVNFDNSKGGEEEPYLDVFVCELTRDKELANPKRLSNKVNSKYHDGPAFYSFAQNTLYITRTNMKGGKPVRDKNGNVNLKIYESKYENGQWTAAQEWRYNNNDYSTGHATLSKDGQTMYFVSTKPGGFGGSDIHVCYRSGEGWSEPENLGPIINTEGNEMFPSIGDDGVLYFTSDGHAGLGGLDIFMSEFKDGKWQVPRNMGAPINSHHDDFALIYDISSDLGFFCSNRSGMGDDDIFSYKHRHVNQMMVAGTLKAGVKTYQRLSESERFEFSAMAGEKVEVYMMNGEYFDETTPALVYEVPNVNDPYIHTGSNMVALSKVPNHNGKLTRVEGEGLAMTKTFVTNDATASTNAAVIATESPATNAGATTSSSPQSSTAPADENVAKYNSKLAEADALLAAGNLVDARKAYTSASAMMPSNKYAQNQLAMIDQRLEEERLTNDRAKYATLVKEADELLAQGKQDEAVAAYKSALSILLEEKYPKERIAEIEKAQRDEQYAKNSGMASKSEFDFIPSYIDLNALQIDNIHFDYNKALIRKDDIATLDQVGKLMKENPNTRLLIRAHSDSRGSKTYNESLSMSRAMAIQGYLMQKGIKRDRFKSEWYGEQRSLNGCDDGVPCEEDEYGINRRCEFKLVEIK